MGLNSVNSTNSAEQFTKSSFIKAIVELFIKLLYSIAKPRVNYKQIAREFVTEEDKKQLREKLLPDNVFEYYLSKITFFDMFERLDFILTLHSLIRDQFHPVKVADKDDNGATAWDYLFIRSGLSFDVVYGFEFDDFYALSKEEFMRLKKLTMIDDFQYIDTFWDCDNFALSFKGVAQFITGKPVVGLITGGIFLDKYGNTKPIGYHAWNAVNLLETDPSKLIDPSTAKPLQFKYKPYRIYYFEPQTDELSIDGKYSCRGQDCWYKCCCGFVWMW